VTNTKRATGGVAAGGGRGLSSAARIIVWTALLVTVAGVLLTVGVTRFRSIGGHISRAERAVTAQRSIVRTRDLHAEIYEAFGSVDPHGAPSERAEALTSSLVPSQALVEAWNAYLKTSLHLRGEAQLVDDYDRAYAGYAKVAQENGTRLASSALSPAEVRRALAAVQTAEREVVRVLDRLDALYDRAITSDLSAATYETDRARHNSTLLAPLAFLVVLGVAGLSARSAQRRDHTLRRLERDRYEAARRNEFEAQLQRAFAMAANENGVYSVVSRALEEAAAGYDAQMLVADGPGDQFEVVATTHDGEGGCSVEHPSECIAVRLGQPLEVTSSASLDACPYLRRDNAEACSAMCVPVVIADRPLGVVHVRGGEHEPIDRAAAEYVQLLARRCGEKIGGTRAFARSQAQAATDPLTGLANRRTLERVAREFVATGEPYAIAYGDLDHFKRLNDTNGHEAGDRALRVFARVLDAVTRPGDVAVRYGGEEFVLVLADCDAHMAVTIAERVRETLREEAPRGMVPPFTVSFGIATSEDRDSFDGVLRAADEMLLAAKAGGRDCVRVTPAPGATPDRGVAAA
jgi:diguanylate cyclase (GGDEF)-like protein